MVMPLYTFLEDVLYNVGVWGHGGGKARSPDQEMPFRVWRTANLRAAESPKGSLDCD